MPVERGEVIHKANAILAVYHGVPRNVTRGWYHKFCVRNPIIADRVAQKLSKSRNAVNKEGIIHYFNALIKGTLGLSCTAADVYNMDETSFKTKSQNKKVVAIRGSKNVWYEENTPPYHLTIVVSAASDGTLVHPAFILPGQSCESTILDECPVDDALVTTAPKAFMNSAIFNNWLISFGEWKLRCRAARPAVLVLDNCSSHHGVESEMICEAYGIVLVYLPANATHLLQPLDVAIFRTFKRDIKTAVTTYLRAANIDTLPRSNAISIAGTTFNKLISHDFQYDRCHAGGMFKNGFRTCGAWPLSLPAMLKRLDLQSKNCVNSDLGAAAWIRTQEYARENVITVPARTPKKARKRVVTDGDLFTKEGLHTNASKPTRKPNVKRKKSN
ncbi:hypothetical protein DYB31_009157 [Aphanomyces astaci]|uniref:HTH CENPB-type domain-containing protein n=1 Tax=Aphanomyces astaci TaxID=112090 RepID=A0A397F1W2_APHAT|nr:hypothetical protein DYB31_009157 [Aphanomyces astaci]